MRRNDELEYVEEKSGIIFNIQRYSVHDGLGIRTLVFMKGCPLRCRWCSNPEGQRIQPELGFVNDRCVGANKCNAPCVKACPVEAVTLSEEGKPKTDRRLCTNCGKCADACYVGARKLVGRSMTVEEVLAEVEKDRPFYRWSGGGVTVGGGEPLFQPEFVRDLLKRCHERCLNTAIETCGHAPWGRLKEVLSFTDVVYYDIKHMDPLLHKELTGVPNDLVLRNIKRILTNKMHSQIIIRIPIIHGYNDAEENIKATVRFVAESGGRMMELLPYHALGSSKYHQYDRQYELIGLEPPTAEDMRKLRNIVLSHGLKEMTGVL